MSALLTKAFEKWVAECTASNLPARPDAIIFALMEREPTSEDDAIPEEKITYIVNELTCGQLSQNNIVCSAVVPDDCAFSYDWICLIHQASRTLCGVIKTPVRQKTKGESLIRNFTITYSGIAQSAQVTAPPQSWQVDITPELKTALKAPNHLSEIADEGEEAQQESRDNLGLKKAATMEPQNGIRDRSEGRLATPGAFGFGHIFLPAERIRFNTEDDFLSWVRNATPGEYFVEGDSKIISGGVLFNGMVRIRWVEARNNPPEPRYTAKAIIFYGINGDVYYNRYWTTGNGYLTGWENLKITSQDIISLLSGIAPGTTDGWYGAGSLVLAAYNGKGDADTDRRIKRGYSYPGSRLSAVEFMCHGTTGSGVGYNDSVSVYVRGSGGGIPGSYRALSGDGLGSAGSASVMIGLFIRIA
ncbi:phage tail protein [Escherichia coli]|uniref:Phage tail protein n=1 Tax=Escherichia coli TaxID=562 RepID=A0A8S7IGW8_ECOLX|nr:phage tail protein [Escherichia coli]EFC2248371.1 phage tail protein [Escherichia coli]EMB0626166.1 phage tail protein [Escherichia coli]HDX6761454.1 phage tail protein [Escherichia coli]